MTTPRQPGVSVRSLNDLLLRLPTPGGEPSSADWSARLERTLSQVHAGLLRNSPQSGDDCEAQLLRTPLPLEPGEPGPTSPFRFDSVEEREFDELRAPLKSGEHFPLAESVTTLQSSSAKSPNRRFSKYWLSSGVGVLAAAAAFAIYGNRAQRVESGLAVAPVAAVASEGPSWIPEAAASVAQAPSPEPTEREHASASPVKKAAPMVQAASQANATRRRSLDAPSRPTEEAELEPALTPAAGPSNLVEHPSIGAVNAALAAAVPVAQRCLSTAAPEASARITFKADGSVQKVSVSGMHLTDSTRACIEQALSRSRVEPFARSQFEVTRNLSLPKNQANSMIP